MPVVAAVLIEPQGDPKKILRVTLPLGMQLIQGTRVIIDQGQPMTAPYVICFTNGCMADYEASTQMIDQMKKGHGLVVQAINANAQPISLALPFADFAKAYDGPPTDPKVFEASSAVCRKNYKNVPKKRARNSNRVSRASARRHRRRERRSSSQATGARVLVAHGGARAVPALAVLDEHFGDLRMTHRLAAGVRQ